ncbi:MAG TPA: dihydrodipicolinate synthase family protein [Limnochordales bacterium]|nr:dihydrodipicolinate synthase family protein [Limnochordales bacterium]
MSLAGVFNIMATPFTPDGAVDAAAVRGLVEFQLRAGAHGLVILGIMGEAHKLRDAERALIIETVMETVAGRVPVVVTVSHSSTDVAVGWAREAAAAGAAAVMAAPPYRVHNPQAIFDHFRRLAEEGGLPVVVQDEPVHTGVLMPVELLVRITDGIDGCRYIKLEEAPTPRKVGQVLAQAQRPVGVFGGLGGVQFYYELCRGAVGTMTGFAFTEVLVEIYRRFQMGDREGARAVFYRHLPILAYEGQPGIGLAIRKEILYRRGAIPHPGVRPPAMTMDPDTRAELEEVLAAVGRAKI